MEPTSSLIESCFPKILWHFLPSAIMASNCCLTLFLSAPTDLEFATWGNSLKQEHARAQEVLHREGLHLAEKFVFMEVNNYSADELADIIRELGAVPPKEGQSGFIATWRDGMGRLYEGQPQSSYLANWLLTLETTQLYKFLSGPGPRKSFWAQENVRVIGYFRDVNVRDPKSQFGDFMKVAKRYHLDIEFAAIIDRGSAKAFKLKYPGDIVIVKPQEAPIYWSAQASEFHKAQKASINKRFEDPSQIVLPIDTTEEDADDENVREPLWNVNDLNEFIKMHQKPLWNEISVPTMFKHWFSTKPKALFIFPSPEARTRHEPTVQGLNAFKNLAKNYARQLGLEFLAADASVFTQLPVALRLQPSELPAFTLFIDSKEMDQHVMTVLPNETPKEVQHKMRVFIDAYVQEINLKNHLSGMNEINARHSQPEDENVSKEEL